MRLFVALEIPEPVRREVRRRVAGLRERLPRARWVDPDVLHLTLLFLGEVAPELVGELAGRLGKAFGTHPALPLRLTGGGTFPAGRPARVAWIGVAGPPELAPLQAAVVRAAREALELREAGERPYQPHVTLARCPSPWPRGAAEKFAAAFPAEIGPPFVADRGVLVESRLSPRGPRYRHLAELPLAAAAGEEPGVGSEPGAEEERDSGRNASAEEPDSGKAGSAGERSA